MFRNFPFHLTFTFICNYWIFLRVLSYYLSHIYRICNDAPFLFLILSLGPLYLFLMSLIILSYQSVILLMLFFLDIFVGFILVFFLKCPEMNG